MKIAPGGIIDGGAAERGSHIDDAVASLETKPTDEQTSRLEAPYSPRYDFQRISDDAEGAPDLRRIGLKPARA